MINIQSKNRKLVIDLIENKKFSEFVNNCIEEKLLDIDGVNKEIKETKNRLKQLKQRKKQIAELNLIKIKQSQERPIISDNELKFWKETIKLLADKPSLIDGRKNLYNNKFVKEIDIAEFRTLYIKYKEELK